MRNTYLIHLMQSKLGYIYKYIYICVCVCVKDNPLLPNMPQMERLAKILILI